MFMTWICWSLSLYRYCVLQGSPNSPRLNKDDEVCSGARQHDAPGPVCWWGGRMGHTRCELLLLWWCELLLFYYMMGDSLASPFYWIFYKQGELDDKTLIGRANHLIQKTELTFTKKIFNDIFHINTKYVLFEHVLIVYAWYSTIMTLTIWTMHVCYWDFNNAICWFYLFYSTLCSCERDSIKFN